MNKEELEKVRYLSLSQIVGPDRGVLEEYKKEGGEPSFFEISGDSITLLRTSVKLLTQLLAGAIATDEDNKVDREKQIVVMKHLRQRLIEEGL